MIYLARETFLENQNLHIQIPTVVERNTILIVLKPKNILIFF